MTDFWPMQRRAIIRDAIGIGIGAGAYAIGFGALSVASGFTLAQTMVFSLVMFTGASQFAYVGVVGSGGGQLAAALAALLLGLRNALYGLRMAPALGVTGWRRLVAVQLTIDESTAMAVAHHHRGPKAERLAFWSTGIAIYILWNSMTLLGAVGAGALGDPRVYGLDAIVPAAMLALLWPRLRDRETWAIAAASALVAVALTPVLKPGLPVLAAALVAVAAGLRPVKSGAVVVPDVPSVDEAGPA